MQTPSRLPRMSWWPGAALLWVALVLGVAGGLVLGARSWPTYLGLVLAWLLAMGAFERLWVRLRAPAPRHRSRVRLKVIRGGKTDYDLADDDSTDSQRYLM
jgi:hypothetical protein